jgi:hypothetical protein
MRTRTSGLIQVLAAVFIGAACGGAPTPVATATPTPAAVLDDHFGFLIGNAVRSESDPKTLFVLDIAKDSGGVVSPDGRSQAYWATNELRVIKIAPGAQPRTLIAITGKGEGALYFAWSTDSTGLVVGVNGGGGGQADAPPGYTALRVVDVAGGVAREIARIRNANVLPLAWDRQAHLIAGYQPSGIGAIAYYTIDESGAVKTVPAGPGLYVVEANQDGTHVLGRGDPNNVVRVWPRESYESGAVLSATGDEHIATVAWRPGTAEIGVLFHGDRLELWDASGARRTIVLPAAPTSSDRYATLAFRADGKGVVITRHSGVDKGASYPPADTYAVAVDLASGRSVAFPTAGAVPLPGTSVRIGS